MALIQFENIPSTNTAINADNLNNNFNYLKDNVLVASLHSEVTVTVNKQYTILPLSQDVKIGDKLSLTNDGGIKIGAGVSYVKIYASLAIAPAVSDNKHFRIEKNHNESLTLLWSYGRMENDESLKGYTVAPVNENDVLNMYYYANTNDVIGGNEYGCRTSLVVETVA